MSVHANNSQSVVGDDSGQRLYSELVLLSAQLEELVAQDKISINCSTGPVRGAFESLTTEAQEAYVDRFRFFVEVVAGARELEEFSEQRLMWQALKMLKVRPPSDMFSYVGPDDYIEIYDRQGIQIFRNFGFCKLITYTLHELLIHPWTSLYERDPKITEQILASVEKLWGETMTMANLPIETHVAKERSATPTAYNIEMKYFAPLFDENNEACFLLAGSSISSVKAD